VPPPPPPPRSDDARDGLGLAGRMLLDREPECWTPGPADDDPMLSRLPAAADVPTPRPRTDPLDRVVVGLATTAAPVSHTHADQRCC